MKIICLFLMAAVALAGSATYAAAESTPGFGRQEVAPPAAVPGTPDQPTTPVLEGGIAKYTGIIKNKTNYEINIPSANSGATLTIPANCWIEYIVWTDKYDVTAYHDGKPFYCLKIAAHPNQYPFMCKNYDFMTEIVKPGLERCERGVSGPSKLKPRKFKRRVNKDEPC
jgi:hypothetical protein